MPFRPQQQSIRRDWPPWAASPCVARGRSRPRGTGTGAQADLFSRLHRRRNIALGGFMTKTLLLFSMFVLAANAGDFTSAKASADSTGNLVVSWRETGLTPGDSYTYQAGAVAAATYWCLETGVRHPNGISLPEVHSTPTFGGVFKASKSGTVSGQLSLAPPPPPDPAVSCPIGPYVVVLHDVTYTAVGLENLTEPNSVDISGTFSVLMFGRTVGNGKGL